MKEHNKLYSQLKDLIIDNKVDDFLSQITRIQRGTDMPNETFDMVLDVAASNHSEIACK
jgi:hypothetical protein